MKYSLPSILVLGFSGAALVGCATATADSMPDDMVSEASQALEVGEIAVYRAGHPIDESELSPLDPVPFGGQILDGDVEWSGRFDLVEGPRLGGVFQATQGTYSVLYPGAVHGTIIMGQVKTTALGHTYLLNSGDSFIVSKGTEVVFETLSQKHQASFLGDFASPDQPGQFFVHPRGSVADESDLVVLGTPEDWNATVLEGDAVPEARIDYNGGYEVGGIFRITPSKLSIAASISTNHGTVLRYGLTVTGADGVPHKLVPGDAFMIRQGSPLIMETGRPQVQGSVLHVFGP